ncbi:hypothetical protein Y886_11560 [Xanthomonas hyacinthi DSM 19077]|nr:hypothetical protein Y886_11560 [Xanthomonas hyacinthi DSM 19077]
MDAQRMKPFPTLPSLLFAFGALLVAVASAQEPARAHPPQDPQLEAALDDCWIDIDGKADDPDDGVDADLMDLCMADKGFDAPPEPAPRPDGGPPPRRSSP